MIEFLTYDAKVAVLIAVFYMFYRLLLARETFHRVNRIVLLTTAALSFVLPLCIITTHHNVVIPQMNAAAFTKSTTVADIHGTPLWQISIIIVFFIGMAVTLCSTALSFIKVWRVIAKCEKHRQTDGITIAVSNNPIAPFSFLGYIVLNRADFIEHDAAILAHERAHIRLRHSIDVIVTDIITALQWFNPAIWMLRADLRSIHEYEADAAVLRQNINARQYQYLLIKKAAGSGGYSIANSFNHSTLKNRITMMLRRKSANTRMLKLLFALPIIGVTVALNAETVNDYGCTGTRKNVVNAVEVRKTDNNVECVTLDKKCETVAGATVTGNDRKKVVTASPKKKAKLKNDGSASKKAQTLDDYDFYIDGVKSSKSEFDTFNPSDIESITINTRTDNGKKNTVIGRTKKASRTE